MDERREGQLRRERSQREAALGHRLRSIERGDLGPSLQRWVSGAIVPVAGRLRVCATAALNGETEGLVSALSSSLFGLPESGSVTALKPLLEWLLKGKSTGFSSGATYAEDMVLAALGVAVVSCAGEGKPIPLTRVLGSMADALRETVIGQFLTTVQGAKAMERVRKGKEHTWQERKQLDTVAALLAGQVRSALGDSSTAGELTPVNGREVVEIFNEKGTLRQITLRRPSAGDWAVLNLARKPKGEADTARPCWLSLAMMVLCAAQAEAGWFDLVKITREPQQGARAKASNRAHSKAHGLVLSDEAMKGIQTDLKRWLQMGFVREPMLTPPENGDYLSVKHRTVLGARGPMGIKTDATGSLAWSVAAGAMGGTAWEVALGTLNAVSVGGPLRGLAEACEPSPGRLALTLASYARNAASPFYFPIRMDFRGRVYLQPPVVTYQGKDLQKGLLRFPAAVESSEGAPTEEGREALVWAKPRRGPIGGPSVGQLFEALPAGVRNIILPLHLGALYGGPDKLDKAPLPRRVAWLQSVLLDETPVSISGMLCLGDAEDPVQLFTALSLLQSGEWDSIPCQIDGTCNGLQHLSALFRDETAAPFVNLCAGGYESSPADIYAEVASRVLQRLGDIQGGWARRLLAVVKIDRKLCKKPVMVLPYGGQRATIEEACLSAILEQYEKDPDRFSPEGISPWHECLYWGRSMDTVDGWLRDTEALEGNYLAFRGRELENHPLLHLDAKRLGGIVWDVIEEVLPRPIAAMASFRAIAKAVGGRTLEWSTGFAGGAVGGPLWVVQAKAKSQSNKLAFKGFHLPGSVRGLKIRVGRDEVDPAAHTSGIVANFIHSHDADHMARTMKKFHDWGGKDFGAIHDCFITRPSQMGLLMKATREAFFDKYGREENHPLRQPVRLRDVGTGLVEEFKDWYALAEYAKVDMPAMGIWEPKEVLDSAWFFS